jgi:hypothetical protein
MVVPTTDNVVLAKATDAGSKDTVGSYAATQKIWVDPKTGAFIDQHGTQTMKTTDGSVVLDIDVAYTDQTVTSNVDKAKSNGRMLTLVRIVIPIGGLVLGLVLIVAGLWLARGGSRRDRTAASRPTMAGATA